MRAIEETKTMRKIATAVFLAAILAGGAVLAQHAGHGNAAGGNAATRAFRAANDKMHKDMDIRYSGDADKDFVAGMIAHHDGAVAMAKIVLQYGKDAEIKALASDIIREQEKEIAQMRAWQARNR